MYTIGKSWRSECKICEVCNSHAEEQQWFRSISSEDEHRLIFLRQRDSIHIETVTNRLTQFDHIASLQLTEELRRGAGDRLHQKFKHAAGGGERRRRGDGKDRAAVAEAEMQVLAGAGVGRGELGGARYVDGNEEQRFGDGGDFDERSGGTSSQLEKILSASPSHQFLVYFESFQQVEEFLQVSKTAEEESGPKKQKRK
ncbi:hypothetical protein SASPL_143835 [Salvia splendens]|uniref:Uncharacterized protein n=1 Tax=Salvia splendens TaxID=180675 RepID=A0A8X8WLJ0_SALSN|nr:hypothetical protein SASPL_143835 [Salvia splendens]